MSEYVITTDSSKKEIKIISGGEISIDGKIVNYELVQLLDSTLFLRINNKLHEIIYEKISGNEYFIYLNGQKVKTIVRTELEEKVSELLKSKKGGSAETDIVAPMPGLLLKILKQEGEEVSVGEPVAILEAMKMENEIRSHFNGKIAKIYIHEGESVEKGELILKIN